MIAALAAAGALLLASPPSHVMDQAGVIPDATEADLDRRLSAFEDQHKIEVVVATFDSLMGRPEHIAGPQIAREWAMGSRTAKRAVLISYWKNDRATRIDVTDALPHFSGAKASEIVDQKMIPNFRLGATALGLEAGANEVMKFLGANPWSPTPVVSSRRSGTGKALGGFGSVAFAIVFVIVRIALFGSAGLGGRGYRRGWGSSSWGGSSRSSWGGGGRSSGGGGGFSGRGASGRW